MSFRSTISPKDQAAGRFVSRVRRELQKALAEEARKRGLTQSDLARTIGVNRSVISRELRGRVAEFAWALGRRPVFELAEAVPAQAATSLEPVEASAEKV